MFFKDSIRRSENELLDGVSLTFRVELLNELLEESSRLGLGSNATKLYSGDTGAVITEFIEEGVHLAWVGFNLKI